MKKFDASKSNFGAKGWFFIFYTAIAYLLISCVTNAMSVAVNIYNGMYGWNPTTIYTMISVASGCSVVAAFVMGRLCSKYSPKIISIVLAALYVLGTLLLGRVSAFWQLGLILCIVHPCALSWGYNVNPVMIANWFPRKKGLVMGWATMGLPLGAGLAAKIFIWANTNLGFANAFAPFSAIAFIGLLILVFWVRVDPEDAGYRPDNDTEMTSEQAAKMLAETKQIAATSPWTAKRMLTTKQFWIIVIPFGIQTLFSNGVMGQMIPRLIELGYPQGQAVNMLFTTACIAAAGSYVCGLIDAKLGPKKATMLVFILAIAALLLNLSGNIVLLWISLALIGVCIGGAANFVASLGVEYWGRANFSRAYGVIQPTNQLIGAFGSAFFAQIAARFGGYSASYIAVAVLLLIGLLIFSRVNGDFVKEREAQFAAEDKASC